MLSQGSNLDELKGLSVNVTLVNRNSVRSAPDGQWITTRVPIQHRVYVSQRGNIFDYTEVNAAGHQHSWGTKAALDKAVQPPNGNPIMDPGSLTAWTLDNGRLTRITQLRAGFRISTIVIDPTRLTCTFDNRDEPDPKTGQVWQLSPLNGQPMEIKLQLESYNCVVKRGNIFADDQ